MLPGNNMHFIFFPSLCLHHLHPHPPLSSPLSSPLPSPYIPFVSALSSLLHRLPHLSFLHMFPLSSSLVDFQSCLICVARRVPMKERPMLPTHESFTTRQDLQGTQTSHSQELLTNIVKNIHSKLDFFLQQTKPYFLSAQENTVR